MKPSASKRVRAAKPQPKTTAQQSADFTAEGAPPPGLVGVHVPDNPSLPTQTNPPTPRTPT